MRRLLHILGALTLTVFVAAGIAVGVLAYKGIALDAQSKAYVDKAVPAITAGWSEQQLLRRAAPELRAALKPRQLNSLFATLSRLGSLVRYEGATGGSNVSFMVGTGRTISAFYVAKARFQNGTADIRLVLVKKKGRWQIDGFHVEIVSYQQPAHRLRPQPA